MFMRCIVVCPTQKYQKWFKRHSLPPSSCPHPLFKDHENHIIIVVFFFNAGAKKKKRLPQKRRNDAMTTQKSTATTATN
jgi:hypothetical protein